MATPNYNINYEDERFQTVESEKQAALENVNNTYNNMINQSDKFYQDQVNAAKDYANTQQQIQQENTDFTIDTINQQKEQANKDYTKEQQGAYVDWQKQSNQYGANAEQMAANGLTNTGFSESSQVSMYNTYQNRVATARDTFNRAILNYDNSIKEAQLQNNSKLAEIAYQALQTQLELSLAGFQYKNTLLQTQIEMQNQTEDRYYSRWQDVLGQMNQENQFKESIRQYEQNYKLEQQQFAEQKKQFEKNYQLQIKQFNEEIRQFNEEIARLKANDKKENELKIKQLELQKQQLEEQKRQANLDYQVKQQQLAAAQRSSGGSSGGSSSIKKSSGSSGASKAKESVKKATSSLKSNGTKKTNNNDGWIPAYQMANNLGLPAAVKLDNVVSSREYEKKVVNGLAYYKKRNNSGSMSNSLNGLFGGR